MSSVVSTVKVRLPDNSHRMSFSEEAAIFDLLQCFLVDSTDYLCVEMSSEP